MVEKSTIQRLAHRAELSVDVEELSGGKVRVTIYQGDPDQIGWFLELAMDGRYAEVEARDDDLIVTLRTR